MLFSDINIYWILFGIVSISVIALGAAFLGSKWVLKQEEGSAKMMDLAYKIARGSSSFLQTEYKIIGIVGLVVCFLLVVLGWFVTECSSCYWQIGSFIVGGVASACAGVLGMYSATRANVRTAQAARKGLKEAFKVSFIGGAIMGLGVVGLALLGMVSMIVIMLYSTAGGELNKEMMLMMVQGLTGFALGGELVALFARVAGGIYTKAADVGADIVGKVEVGMPEDDPRNPATIADNVGDNVGDVAGMGADLFGSYVSTFLAAMVLACGKGSFAFTLPLILGATGLVCAFIVIPFVRIAGEKSNVQYALDLGNLAAISLTLIASLGIISYFFDSTTDDHIASWKHLYAIVLTGTLVGGGVTFLTSYFTGMEYRPVRTIIKQSVTGPATNVIAGLSMGMLSTALPMLLFSGAIYAMFMWGHFYGVAIGAASMMTTTAMQLAMDAFGPIADNAGGIAEMSGLPKEVRRRTDHLDAVGNTTAATGKGFAIASAALTSLGLLAAFIKDAELSFSIGLCDDASTLAGLFLGAMFPFVFSALIMGSVGRAAMAMVKEVRHQLASKPSILEGKEEPDYARCISIATYAALKEMMLPGLLTLGLPMIIGFSLGAKVLAAFLVGVIIVGTAMAIFQCNAGGAWDNAKKAFEKGVEIDGEIYHKGSDAHKAAVVGDTVGDPFKDTSGPAMNILIKLSTLVAIIIAPLLN